MPGCPYHVTHRGNRKRTIFLTPEDFRFYLHCLEEYSTRFAMRIWGYCLMPNHIHLIAQGEMPDSIAKAIGNAHRRFARRSNFKDQVTGHAWANRFASTAMDDRHLWAAIRYVELNPVRAHLAERATGYLWSSARAHAGMIGDRLLDPNRPFPGPIGDWEAWLRIGLSEDDTAAIRLNTTTGRPSGSEEFVRSFEDQLSRRLRPKRRGPDPGLQR